MAGHLNILRTPDLTSALRAAVVAVFVTVGFGMSVFAVAASGHGDEHHGADIIKYGEPLPDVRIPAAETVAEQRQAARAARFQARLSGVALLSGDNPQVTGRFELPFDTNDTLDGSPGRELVGPVEQYVDANGDPIPDAFAPPGLVPVFTAVLPSGKLLAWDYEQREGVTPQNNTRVILYDPVTNTSVRKDVRDETAGEGVNIFCAGYSHLPNGDLLVVGGNKNANADPIADTYIFHWQTETWSKGPDMHRKRWYPSVTTMASGETLIVGGDPQDTTSENHGEDEPGHPEVWQLDGSLRPLTNLTQVPNPQTVADFEALPSTRLYPYLAPSVDGRVLYAGMEREWMRLLDPRGNGSQERYGPADLHNRQYGSFAQYLPDRVIVNGGGPVDLVYVGASKDGVEISLTRGTGENASSGPAQGLPSRAQIADMQIPRRMHHLTILADGKVLASGGKKKIFENPEDYDPEANYYGKDLVDLANPAQQAELWDPQTNTWTLMDSAHEQRQYHSFATLLPSGEVLTGGGGDCGACAYFQYDHPEFEVFKPPYLFDENGDERSPAQRPAITGAPSGDVDFASTFNVNFTNPSGTIEKVHLVKLGAATHAIDQGQRLVPLDFTVGSGTLTIDAPANGFEAPPGYYMLFIVNSDGTPSPAKVVRFGGADVAAGEVAPVTAYNAGNAKSQVFGSGEFSAQRGNLAQVGNNAIKRLDVADGYEVYACAGIDLTETCALYGSGDNTVSAPAVDGKISSLKVCAEDECPDPPVDETAPVVTINSPADGSATTDSSVVVEYAVTDAVDPNPSCDIEDGAIVSLVDGQNSITVECTDDSGNAGTDTVVITRDNAAPVVEITSPANGAIVGAASVPVNFTVSDDHDTAPSCTRTSGGSFALAPGSNSIVVQCTDAAGNSGSSSVTVTRDSAAPMLQIMSPADGVLTNASSVVVVFNVIDNLDLSPQCTPANGGTVSLSEGVNTIVVSCVDDAGNTGTDSVTVYRDSTPPQVVIIAPANGTLTDQPSVVLSYAVGGGVEGCDQPIGKAIALQQGNNVIVVNCWDEAGNVGSAAVNVAYVPPVKPEVPDIPPALKLAKKITLGAELRFVPTCPAGCRAQLVLSSGKRRLGGFTGPIQAEVSGKTYYLPIAKRYRKPIKPWIRAKRKVLLKITLVDAKGRKVTRTARVTRVR